MSQSQFRLAPDNKSIFDFYILPKAEIARRSCLTLGYPGPLTRIASARDATWAATWACSRDGATLARAGRRCTSARKAIPYLRTLLVQGAQHILGPFGPDCDLRRWGLKLAERGGGNGKKRAVIGVARKLAVLLDRLWVSGEVYEPLHNGKQIAMVTAA